MSEEQLEMDVVEQKNFENMSVKELQKYAESVCGLDENSESLENIIQEICYKKGTQEKIGDLVIESVEGDGQWDGDSRWVNYIFKIGERFFMISANYDSWEGTWFDDTDWTEVKPVEKTVVDWKAV